MNARIPVRLAAGSGATFGVDDLACAAATHLGTWADEGLDVTWVPALGGVASMRAALAGEVDVAYAGFGPVVRLRAEGQPCRILVSMARSLAQNLVTRRDIAEPAGLRGASWAIDGFGAMSHHMARLVVGALGIEESSVDWQAVGPPPERIERLLVGTVDASLIRVEEALSLGRTHADRLHTLLGFAELKALVPLQPHGVLATTEGFEAENGEALARLVRGMIRASRALHDDHDAFRDVFRHHVTVPVDDADVRAIWAQERDAGGFAVNGETSAGHWDPQLALAAALDPDLPRIERADIVAEGFVRGALGSLGIHPADFDRPG